MAKKKKKKVAKYVPTEEEYRSIINVLYNLKMTFIAEDTISTRLWRHLRNLYLPMDFNRYTASDDYNYPLYDPAPIKALDRSVSGFQSYHISPNDTYFALEAYRDILEPQAKEDTDLVKALEKRAQDIHKVKQEPSNYNVLTRNIRDKIVFNLSGRTIDAHPTSIAKFTYYAPEELALASSDGRQNDIFGVRKILTPFQFNYLYPKKDRLTDFGTVESQFKDILRPRNSNPQAFGPNTLYRFNIPVNVMREYLMIGMDKDKKGHMKAIDSLFPENKAEENNWVDILFTQEDLIKIEIIPFRKIIISKMFPEHMALGVGKGIGEKALGVAIEVNEIAQINLTAYERTYGPSFSVFGEEGAIKAKLGRDEVNFIVDGEKPIHPNSLNANTDAIINYWNHMKAKLDTMFELDVFEMINKNRMPTAEVELRKSDDYRKLGMFLSQDNFDDLNPSVLIINYLIHLHAERQKAKDELTDKVLNARYISALALAHKNSATDRALEALRLVGTANQITSQETELSDSIDLIPYVKETLLKTDAKNLVREEKEETQRKKMRQEMMQDRAIQEKSNAIAANTDALRANEEAQQSLRGPGPQDGNATGRTQQTAGRQTAAGRL